MLHFFGSNWVSWWAVAIVLCLRWYHVAVGSQQGALDAVDHDAAEMWAACESAASAIVQ